jgi:DNA-binding transcriptional LysR family regulator
MVQVEDVFRSEREDWIQTMVMAGMGICFMPEYSAVLPGLLTRPICDPSVTRTIHLATVAGRRFSPAVSTFIKAIDRYQWPVRAESITEALEPA